MPIYSTIFIEASVGRGGRNKHPDVVTVQQRLNELMHPPRVPLAVDGKSGPKTKGMIRDFQRSVLKFKWPDSRVDPNGKTLTALNHPDSEGEWAKMSIPDFEPDNSGGGGGGGKVDPVDEIMEELIEEFSMTGAEADAMRPIVEQALKDTRPGGPKTAEQVGSYSRIAFKALRNALVFSPANSAGWVVAQYLGVVAPFLMFYGFIKTLEKSMQAGCRVYGAVGAAYATAYWVHGGMKPFGCRTLINRNNAKPAQDRNRPEDMEKCWREGWKSAWDGMEKHVYQAAGKIGAPVYETRAALKMVMGTVSAVEIARTAMRQIAEDLKYKDPNVANSVRLNAERLRYPN